MVSKLSLNVAKVLELARAKYRPLETLQIYSPFGGFLHSSVLHMELYMSDVATRVITGNHFPILSFPTQAIDTFTDGDVYNRENRFEMIFSLR